MKKDTRPERKQVNIDRKMTTKNTLNLLNSIQSDLKIGKKLVYDKCGFDLTNLRQNSESKAYGAYTFELNGKTIHYRVSKITPTKTGQFVAIWKRNENGFTEPFDFSDNFDYVIITARNDNSFGQFIFPKLVLAEKGIIMQNGKAGKRGIRVYPPWDNATSKKAEKTQNWQTTYFLPITNDNSTDLNLAKKLLMLT